MKYSLLATISTSSPRTQNLRFRYASIGARSSFVSRTSPGRAGADGSLPSFEASAARDRLLRRASPVQPASASRRGPAPSSRTSRRPVGLLAIVIRTSGGAEGSASRAAERLADGARGSGEHASDMMLDVSADD